MPADVELRPAAPGDAAALAALAAAALPEAWSAAGFRRALEAPAGVGRAAVDGSGRLVGFALASRAADELEISTVAVAPAHRRRGLGRALLASLLESERAGGARRVFLEVRAGNAPARALYAALGFDARGERRAYYRDGEAAIVMGRAL